LPLERGFQEPLLADELSRLVPGLRVLLDLREVEEPAVDLNAGKNLCYETVVVVLVPRRPRDARCFENALDLALKVLTINSQDVVIAA